MCGYANIVYLRFVEAVEIPSVGQANPVGTISTNVLADAHLRENSREGSNRCKRVIHPIAR